MKTVLVFILCFTLQAHAATRDCENRLNGARGVVTILGKALDAGASNANMLRTFVAANDWTAPIDGASLTGPTYLRAFTQASVALTAEDKAAVRAGVRDLLAAREGRAAQAADASEDTRQFLNPRSTGFKGKAWWSDAHEPKSLMRMATVDGRPMFLELRKDPREGIEKSLILDPFNTDPAQRERVVTDAAELKPFFVRENSIESMREKFDKKFAPPRRSDVSINVVGTRTILAAARPGGAGFMEGQRKLKSIEFGNPNDGACDVMPIVYAAGERVLASQRHYADQDRGMILTIDLATGEELSKIESPYEETDFAVTYLNGKPRLYYPNRLQSSRIVNGRWHTPIFDPLTGETEMVDVAASVTPNAALDAGDFSFLIWASEVAIVVYDIQSKHRSEIPAKAFNNRQVIPFMYQGKAYVMIDRARNDQSELFELFGEVPVTRGPSSTQSEDCETRLEPAVKALMAVFTSAMEAGAIDIATLLTAFDGENWENPFIKNNTHVASGQFRRAFDAWSDRITPEVRHELHTQLSRIASEKKHDREKARRARRDVHEVLAPTLIDRISDREVKEGIVDKYRKFTYQGRPAWTAHIMTKGARETKIDFEMVYDPFNPDKDRRLRYIQSIPHETFSPDVNVVDWHGQTYFVRPQQKQVLNAETGEDESRKFNFAERLSEGEWMAAESISVQTQGGPKLVMRLKSADGSRSAIYLFDLVDRNKPKERLFETYFDESRPPSLSSSVVEGKQFLVVEGLDKILIWDSEAEKTFSVIDVTGFGRVSFGFSQMFNWNGRLTLVTKLVDDRGEIRIHFFDVTTGKHVHQIDDAALESHFVYAGGVPWVTLLTSDDFAAIRLTDGLRKEWKFRAHGSPRIFAFQEQHWAVASTSLGTFNIVGLGEDGSPIKIDKEVMENLVDIIEYQGGIYLLTAAFRKGAKLYRLNHSTSR